MIKLQGDSSGAPFDSVDTLTIGVVVVVSVVVVVVSPSRWAVIDFTDILPAPAAFVLKFFSTKYYKAKL